MRGPEVVLSGAAPSSPPRGGGGGASPASVAAESAVRTRTAVRPGIVGGVPVGGLQQRFGREAATERRLAGDARAGTYARRKARVDQRAFLRRHWKSIAGFYVVAVVLLVVPVQWHDSDFLRGLVTGLTLAGIAGALAVHVVVQTGTGPTMAGELAEQWTAQELRPLLAHGYRLANHVQIAGRGDADHVLIGPGGHFVLETKWSATAWDGSERHYGPATQQVSRRAKEIWLQAGAHHLPPPVPVLVLWGEAAKGLDEVRRRGDVVVVPGSRLRQWMLGRPRGVLTAEQMNRAYATVRSLAAAGDRVEAPMPPSAWQLYMQALLALATAVASLLLPLFAVRVHVTVGVALALVGMVTGAVLWRRGLRWWGAGSMTGASGALAVYAYAVLTSVAL